MLSQGLRRGNARRDFIANRYETARARIGNTPLQSGKSVKLRLGLGERPAISAVRDRFAQFGKPLLDVGLRACDLR